MKNMAKKKFIKDAMTEARKDKNYLKYYEAAKVRVRLAIEVFKGREARGLTQQELAKMVGTTQKVISRIENADVNVGIDLLNRIAEGLNFVPENLATIFNSSSAIFPSIVWSPEMKSKKYIEVKEVDYKLK